MSSRAEEFREYARARAGPLHQSAFLLCGDWHLAHDLVQDMKWNPEIRKEFKENEKAVLDRYPMLAEERRASYREAQKDIANLKTKRAELGDAIKQMLEGRNELYTEGDKMAANVQKFVDAASGTPFERRMS